MSCPNCGHTTNTPINIENTFFECNSCRYRYHIAGINNTDIDFILADGTPMAIDLTRKLRIAKENKPLEVAGNVKR